MDRSVIGRDAELAVVAEFLDGTAEGAAGLIVEGEAGIGKTTLWQAGTTLAQARSYRTLVARAAEAEVKLSFVGLCDLLEDVGEDELGSLPDPQRRALEVALRRSGDPAHTFDQGTIGVALLAVLRGLARAGPVVVAIDDIHWLDVSSARVISFAARRLGPAPVGFLVSRRHLPGLDEPLGLDRALAAGRLRAVPVAPLSVGGLHEVIRVRLGVELRRQLALKVHAASGGNPFYAIELTRALRGREASLSPGDPLPVPENLRELVRQRLAYLSPAAREAVFVASAVPSPTTTLVEAVLGPGAAAAVLEAAQEGVIVVEPPRMRFTHPLLSSIAYLEAEPGHRRRMHGCLSNLVADPEARARHLALAATGPAAEVATALEAAAGLACARGAPDAAAELYEHARHLTPAAAYEDTRRRALAEAHNHFLAGDRPRARAILEEVLATLNRGPARAEVLRRLGVVHSNDDSFSQAATALHQALAEAGDNRHLSGSILLILGYVLVQTGDLPAASEAVRQAVRLVEPLGDSGLTAEALGALAICDFVLGRGLAEDVLRRALTLEDPHRRSPLLMRPSFEAALLRMWTGELEEARVLFEGLRSDLVERGEDSALPMLLGLWGGGVQAQCWLGDLDRAGRYAAEARAAAAQVGDVLSRSAALTAEVVVHAHRGDADLTRRKTAEAVALFDASASPAGRIFPLRMLGFLEMSLGRWAAAHEVLAPLTRVGAWAPGDPGCAPAAPDEIEALVSLGRLPEARTLLESLDRSAHALDRGWVAAAAARSRALILAAEGDLDQALCATEQATALLKPFPMPFELGRTLLVTGCIHRRRKEKQAASTALDRAATIFEDIGAAAWVRRVRDERARVSPRPAGPRTLTPTEERVARLAAGGLSTKEIAERAFLAPKTVEGVLGRVYTKLGLHSRAALATQFVAAGDTNQGP